MKIDINNLKTIDINSVGILRDYARKNFCLRSAFSPVNLFIWGSQFNAQYMFVDNRLVIYNKAWNCILLPSSSKFPPPLLHKLSKTFSENNKCGKVSFLPQEYIDRYQEQLKEDFDIFRDRNNADYVYLAENLAALKGKKLQKKKNQISQFKRRNPGYVVSSLIPSDFEECYDLSEKWITDHHRRHPGYQYEKHALDLAFKHFETLHLAGKKIVIEDKIAAFSISSELNDEMALIHFEKFDRSKKGSAQIINWEMAKNLTKHYRFMNREEDMGIEQLRKAKRSYQPYAILESYVLERKKDNTD